MRLALAAPIIESVPPKLYGGTERIVSYLTEELVLQGHDVTLFASGDSTTKATLCSSTPKSLRLSGNLDEATYAQLISLSTLQEAARDHSFDCLHFHTDALHFPLMHEFAPISLSTFHSRLDMPIVQKMFRHYPNYALSSISNSQREFAPNANWLGTVLHGLPANLYSLGDGGGGYLAFCGRLSPEKGFEHAVKIAATVGLPLKVAAKLELSLYEPSYRDRLLQLLDDPNVTYIGELNDAQKNQFFGDALALLFPITWPEPFGLVMIEAMACGTPVLAFTAGSTPEVIRPNVSGILVTCVEEAIAHFDDLLNCDRKGCRREFDEFFTAKRMANDYLKLYATLANQAKGTVGGAKSHSIQRRKLHFGELTAG